MTKVQIAVLPGDGIGPEIMVQAVRVAETVFEKFGYKPEFRYGLVGADAIRKTGNPYPDDTHHLCRESDAVLFGAIGHPDFDNNPKAKVRPEQGLLAMRKELGLYANIRPVFTFPSLSGHSPLKEHLLEKVDFVVVRELTGGIYFGKPSGRSEDGRTAFDTSLYTREEIERVLELAYHLAAKRSGRLTVVDKANVLETSRLWRETAMEMSARYEQVDTRFMFVDNAAMQLILYPGQFDVLVTENMFGDILTDEAGAVAGSLGLLPSASVGLKTPVFEPIHGSWPEAAGKNIANPLGMILSVAMMFEYAFNMPGAATLIQDAVNASLEAGMVTGDLAEGKAFPTTEVGTWIVNQIREDSHKK